MMQDAEHYMAANNIKPHEWRRVSEYAEHYACTQCHASITRGLPTMRDVFKDCDIHKEYIALRLAHNQLRAQEQSARLGAAAIHEQLSHLLSVHEKEDLK